MQRYVVSVCHDGDNGDGVANVSSTHLLFFVPVRLSPIAQLC